QDVVERTGQPQALMPLPGDPRNKRSADIFDECAERTEHAGNRDQSTCRIISALDYPDVLICLDNTQPCAQLNVAVEEVGVGDQCAVRLVNRKSERDTSWC